MKLKEFKNYFKEKLSDIYPNTEISTFFYYLLEDYLGLKSIDLVTKPNLEIEKLQLEKLNLALKKLQKEEPIQYILGKTEFYGYTFIVDKNTLIPRPETEELVEWVINESESLNIEKLQILDIGTGTGCIPISLAKKLKNADISAIDISKDALKIAKKNAEINQVNVEFLILDILRTQQLSQNYNIIISNPPYVRELEKAEIKNNVLQNEPHLALFVSDENPLIFYDKIADLAKNHLTKNGLLFFEINQYLGKETVLLLKQKGFKNIILKKDMFGNDRMVLAKNT